MSFVALSPSSPNFVKKPELTDLMRLADQKAPKILLCTPNTGTLYCEFFCPWVLGIGIQVLTFAKEALY